jgi:hypothetical protein
MPERDLLVTNLFEKATLRSPVGIQLLDPEPRVLLHKLRVYGVGTWRQGVAAVLDTLNRTVSPQATPQATPLPASECPASRAAVAWRHPSVFVLADMPSAPDRIAAIASLSAPSGKLAP